MIFIRDGAQGRSPRGWGLGATATEEPVMPEPVVEEVDVGTTVLPKLLVEPAPVPPTSAVETRTPVPAPLPLPRVAVTEDGGGGSGVGPAFEPLPPDARTLFPSSDDARPDAPAPDVPDAASSEPVMPSLDILSALRADPHWKHIKYGAYVLGFILLWRALR